MKQTNWTVIGVARWYDWKLGKLSDRDLAKLVGTSEGSIRRRRVQFGIEVYSVAVAIAPYQHLLGVGGGFVIVPALGRYTNLNARSIVATSLAVIALVSLGSVLSASFSGVMQWAVGAPFAAGAVAGLVAARQFAHRLAGPRLQQAFALVGIAAAALLAFSTLAA